MSCFPITSKVALRQSLKGPSWMTCLLVLLQAGCQLPGVQIQVQAPPCSLLSTAWSLVSSDCFWPWMSAGSLATLFAGVTYTLHLPCLGTGSWPKGYP